MDSNKLEAIIKENIQTAHTKKEFKTKNQDQERPIKTE